MATTNGSFTFEGFRPVDDAFQVARLREAGAVIIGKAALEEYATSGHYSNDAWGQVWNVFNPSKSALASSGGSASAVAASMAAAALGSQTGDSLYAPASAAEPRDAARHRRPRERHRRHAARVADRLRRRDDALGVGPRRHAEHRRRNRSGRSGDGARQSRRSRRIGDRCSTSMPSRANESASSRPRGSIRSAPRDRLAAQKAALQYFVDAGATIVEMGITVGGTDTPPQTPDNRREICGPKDGCSTSTVILSSTAQGFKIKTRSRRELLAEESRVRACRCRQLFRRSGAANDAPPRSRPTRLSHITAEPA